jgi:hypothetical protein
MDSAADASAAPDVATLPDVSAPPDAPSSPDASPDAGARTPALDAVFQEQTYWVLFETYPGDGMGTPAVRTNAIMPAFTRVSMPRPGTGLVFNQCPTIGPNGCEQLALSARSLDISGIPTGPSGLCARLEPMGGTVLELCSSAAAIEYRESARYPDRLGQRRYNACWSASVTYDAARPALWAIRGVPGRTRRPEHGDFCVFGIRD